MNYQPLDFDDDLDIPPAPDERRGWLRRNWRWLLWSVLALFAFTVAWLVLTAPLGRALEPLKEPSVILLAADGTPIARRGDYKEAPVDVAELPKYVPGALIAIEDRRFYSHIGIDARAIGRAVVVNVKAGGVREGGSTLTQQLAKTSFLSSDRSLKRKLQEAIIAFWLEAWLTKDEILSRYLSSVYYGEGAYGLRAAARTYFDRTPEDLTVGQAAMLAGLMVAPSRLAPSRHLTAAQARQRLVVREMVETGVLTAEQGRNIAPARYKPGRRKVPAGSYFADWALPQARATGDAGHYGDRRVTTTLDRKLQADAERFVRDALAGSGIGQAALVAMRPNGEVVAMVGGKNYKASSFNRATQARRQPGSAFKLFVYLAALRAGATPDSIVADTPLTIGTWSPKNDDGRYRGDISLEQAFALSSNVAAGRLTQQVGAKAVIAEARRLGVTAPLADTPALALGVSGVTLVEMTQAYAAVARGVHPVRATGLPPGSAREDWLASLTGVVRAVRPWPGAAPMRDMLQSAVRNGTGRRAALPIETWGKTGTTQNNRDALFIGWAGELVVGVWMGNDDEKPMRGVSGGGAPARLWARFMRSALQREGALPRAAPPPPVVVEPEYPGGFEYEPELDDDTRAAIDAAEAVGGIVGDLGDGQFDVDRAFEAAERVRRAQARFERRQAREQERREREQGFEPPEQPPEPEVF